MVIQPSEFNIIYYMHYSITLYNVLYGSKKWYANLHNEQMQIGIYICTCTCKCRYV